MIDAPVVIVPGDEDDMVIGAGDGAVLEVGPETTAESFAENTRMLPISKNAVA